MPQGEEEFVIVLDIAFSMNVNSLFHVDSKSSYSGQVHALGLKRIEFKTCYYRVRGRFCCNLKFKWKCVHC